MTRDDQISYMLLREEQHRKWAIRAVSQESESFHRMLAATFRRLGEEAGGVADPVIDAIVGGSLYLNW